MRLKSTNHVGRCRPHQSEPTNQVGHNRLIPAQQPIRERHILAICFSHRSIRILHRGTFNYTQKGIMGLQNKAMCFASSKFQSFWHRICKTIAGSEASRVSRGTHKTNHSWLQASFTNWHSAHFLLLSLIFFSEVLKWQMKGNWYILFL